MRYKVTENEIKRDTTPRDAARRENSARLTGVPRMNRRLLRRVFSAILVLNLLVNCFPFQMLAESTPVDVVSNEVGEMQLGGDVSQGGNQGIDSKYTYAFDETQTALLSDFEVKRDRIAREAMTKNVTNISGVPSWMLSVLNRVMEITGKTHLEEVWPNLEVFFHGGVAFTPYRKQYEQLITSPRMHYMETYNASEGFFGLQDDPADKSMMLMLDYGVFYEFMELSGEGAEHTIVPLWGVETGKNYAMLISTSCGLWRYMIGDTIRFTSTNPYKFVISGRTKSFINAFGEELIVDNAEQGLAYACEQTGAEVLEYTAAPVFMDANAKCRHQWLIEFSKPPPATATGEQRLRGQAL